MVEHQTTLVKNLLLDNLTRQKYSMKKKLLYRDTD